jgi:hypothetical protein
MTPPAPRERFTPLGDNLLVRARDGDGPSMLGGVDAWIGTVESLSASLARALIRRGDLVAIRSGSGHLVGTGMFLVEIADVLAIVDESVEVDGAKTATSSHSRTTTRDN